MSERKPQSPPNPNPSDVRQRTLEQMRKLLTGAAVTGASLSAVACEEQIVCDPLPPPLECNQVQTSTDLNRWVYWQAYWLGATVSAGVEVHGSIDVQNPERLIFSGTPTAVGGLVSNENRQTNTLAFDVTPNTAVTQVVVTVPLTCDGEARSHVIRLDLSGTPAAHATVPTQAVD